MSKETRSKETRSPNGDLWFDPPVTAQEVADAAKVHRRTVIRAIHRGMFPRAFLLNGYEWRIPQADAKAYIKTGAVPNRTEGEQK